MKHKLILLFVVLLWLSVTVVIVTIVDVETNKMNSHLGDEFVLSGDTTVIVDCSFWNNSFTLDNGITIHKDLIIQE